MRRSLFAFPAAALLFFGSLAAATPAKAQDVSVQIGRSGLRVQVEGRRAPQRRAPQPAPLPPVQQPAPVCEPVPYKKLPTPVACEPMPAPCPPAPVAQPVCPPVAQPPVCEPVAQPVHDRGPREWRQPSQPVAPREWRAPLCDADYARTLQAMNWRPQTIADQLSRVRWLAGRHTFTVDQVIGIVGTIVNSQDRKEALLVLHDGVCDKAGFTRTYPLLAQCDADQLHVQLNQPNQGRHHDGRDGHGRRQHDGRTADRGGRWGR